MSLYFLSFIVHKIYRFPFPPGYSKKSPAFADDLCCLRVVADVRTAIIEFDDYINIPGFKAAMDIPVDAGA